MDDQEGAPSGSASTSGFSYASSSASFPAAAAAGPTHVQSFRVPEPVPPSSATIVTSFPPDAASPAYTPPPPPPVGGGPAPLTPAAHRAHANTVDDRTSALAADRLRDGLCPTCGTRLYKLKRKTKMMGLVKVKESSDGSGSEFRRVPLTIEGEVMRGQCLRCSGGGAGASAAVVNTRGASSGVVSAGLESPPSVNLLAPVPPPPPLDGGGAGEDDGGWDGLPATPAHAVPADPHPHGGEGHEDVPDALARPMTTNDLLLLDPTSAATAAPVGPASAAASPPLATAHAPQQVSATYQGEYNDAGQRHGYGELLWENGDRYEGMFWNGMRDGEGTLHFADGTEYVGTWRLNRMNGRGTRRYRNGNVYTGEYKAGKREGQGRCYFANGDMYVGGWKDDSMHGFGRYHYNTGRAFEGNFRNGKRDGRGKFQDTDGKVDIHRYVDDMTTGEGVRWSKDRKKAWRLLNGKKGAKITMEEARRIADNCGPVVDYAH